MDESFLEAAIRILGIFQEFVEFLKKKKSGGAEISRIFQEFQS
jgi:hypothetical protein